MTDDGVAWTDALRAEVIPSRRFRNDTYLRTKLKASQHLDFPFDRAQCLRPVVASSTSEWRERVRAAVAKNPAAWRPAVEAAIENAMQPEARGALDVDTEVAAVTLQLYPLWAALPFWIVEAGAVFALRALIRCHEVAALAGPASQIDHLVEREANGPGQSTYDRWIVLRSVLAEAIEPVYDEAHGIADHARLETPHTDLAISLAFAFPEEHAWAAEPAANAVALAKRPRVCYELSLYLVVAPIEAALDVIEHALPLGISHTSFPTLLAHHGRAAVPVLAKVLERARSDQDRKILGHYLLAIRDPAVARALADVARTKPKNRVLAQLARRAGK